ncbi:DsbA family protein [Pseudalkalibacillus decolorationis]|uniref:DsbA family protein n=1 Tax=Pseudalkalibacillus decolorationis TaxID=163879 RepID=UPI002148EF60|nr:DsbA family protein [Pseudalkalibacillus decolorationis]
MAKKKKNQTVYKPPKNSNKGFILIIGGIFVLAAVLLFVISNQEEGTNEQSANNDVEVNYEGQPSIGEEDAPVKIVEFADFKCPACAQFEAEVYPQIKADFIDTGKAELFMVNKPFLAPDSKIAASVGEAVYAQDEKAFWKYYDVVFKNQGSEQEAWATEEFLIGLIEKNIKGIDTEQLKKDLEANKFEDEIETDIKMSNQVQSTPTIIINGKMIENPFDYENSIKPAIEEALENNE